MKSSSHYVEELALADESGVYDETCGVSNPAALIDAYVAMFLECGGAVLKAGVTGLVLGDAGWRVGLDGADDLPADEVVIAAGA